MNTSLQEVYLRPFDSATTVLSVDFCYNYLLNIATNAAAISSTTTGTETTALFCNLLCVFSNGEVHKFQCLYLTLLYFVFLSIVADLLKLSDNQ